METTWKIFSLNSNSADGGVTIAHWGVTATETVEEETYTAYRYGACGFSPDASDPSFVPYEGVDLGNP
ncbi:MAG: hypothetical protein ACO3SO_10925 [Luteolibacter sp.]